MFSVVIPLYNKEKYINRAINSILEQSFQNFEIIIVDDGSTDSSMDEVKKFDDPRIHLIAQKNAGVSAARNKGIEEAKNEYIAFLDADDEWLPDYLKLQYEMIKKFSECDLFATSYFVNRQGVTTEPKLSSMPFEKEGIIDYFCIAYQSDPPVWTSAVIVRKDALQSIGGFSVGITSGEDLVTWAKLATKGKVAYLKQPQSIYYVDEEPWEEGRLPDEDDFVGKELIKLWKVEQQDLCLKKYIAYWYKIRSAMYLRHKKRLNAMQESLKALSYDPFTMKNYRYVLLSLLPDSFIRLLFKYKVEKQ